MCLLPVIGGVAIASAADLSFTWDCFAYAMGSNVAFSLRGVLSKKAMGQPMGENMDVGNMFAVMTTFAFLAVLPVALALEGPTMQAEWQKAIATGVYSETELILRIVASGLSFYLYNEARAHARARRRARSTSCCARRARGSHRAQRTSTWRLRRRWR